MSKKIVWTGNEGFLEMKEKFIEQMKLTGGDIPEDMRSELEWMDNLLKQKN